MANNTRFTGTYELVERDRYSYLNDIPDHRRPCPPYYGRYELNLKVKGEIEFQLGSLNGKIPLEDSEEFVCQENRGTMQREAINKFKDGGVDKMIKNMIIKAINRFRFDKECDLAEKEYEELLSGVKKHSIEFTIKQKDLI